ncbi:MAG: prepilin-type N-terminal cleavage/methylation domain-containing protein [Armatimonas sp.]
MKRKLRAGLTLLELIIAVAIMAILVGALAFAFSGGLNYERVARRRQTEAGRVEALEKRLTHLIQSARLPANGQTDTSGYFIAATESGDSSLGAERITFQTTGDDVPLAARESADDFETQHEARGPVGGLAEVSLSMTAVGDAGNRQGLFERLQRPSDADPDQGGQERVLSPDVVRLGFEFYNGTDWITTWDTTDGGTEVYRLPAAVRVNYAMTGDPETLTRQLVVPIAASDVTADNPLEETSGGTSL